MCDTILGPPRTTANGNMLFGKNSDRQRNEAQALQMASALVHPPASTLRCTYIEIPQAPLTHAVLLSRPFWAWGAEMGANFHGVVIGNEGLHSRAPPSQDEALIGMDLVRLGLERGANAAEALETITTLLNKYGQGGNCGHLRPAYYNNSFLIADPHEAYVLETVGRDWVVDRVADVRGISNHYSIGTEVCRKSAGLDALIHASGYGEEPIHYAEALANPETEHIGQSRGRRARTHALMKERAGRLDMRGMIAVLRDHRAEHPDETGWNPREADSIGICMHGGRHDAQTTGSWVSELGAKGAVHWVTGTSAPCMSIFKPLILGTPLPNLGPWPGGTFDPESLWWRHERLYRGVLLSNLPGFLEEIRAERDALEANFQSRVADLADHPGAQDQVIADCWREAMAMEADWAARLGDPLPGAEDDFARNWREMSRVAQLERAVSAEDQS